MDNVIELYLFHAMGKQPQDYLQVFLGHDQPDTTQIYTATAAIDTQKAFYEAVKQSKHK